MTNVQNPLRIAELPGTRFPVLGVNDDTRTKDVREIDCFTPLNSHFSPIAYSNRGPQLNTHVQLHNNTTTRNKQTNTRVPYKEPNFEIMSS